MRKNAEIEVTLSVANPAATGGNDVESWVRMRLHPSDFALSPEDFTNRYLLPAAAQIIARQNRV